MHIQLAKPPASSLLPNDVPTGWLCLGWTGRPSPARARTGLVWHCTWLPDLVIGLSAHAFPTTAEDVAVVIETRPPPRTVEAGPDTIVVRFPGSDGYELALRRGSPTSNTPIPPRLRQGARALQSL